MRVDLIRHGQVPGNRESRYVGSTDEELTQEGWAAAKAAAQIYEAEFPEMVYVSPMLRCRQTADLLFPGVEQVVIPELKECDFGAFEYKNYQELDGNEDYQAWIDSGGTIGFPGGETQEQFCRRTVAGFRTAMTDAASRGAEYVAVVAHGGTIMAVMETYGIPEGEYFRWQSRNLHGYSLIMINNKTENVREI